MGILRGLEGKNGRVFRLGRLQFLQVRLLACAHSDKDLGGDVKCVLALPLGGGRFAVTDARQKREIPVDIDDLHAERTPHRDQLGFVLALVFLLRVGLLDFSNGEKWEPGRQVADERALSGFGGNAQIPTKRPEVLLERLEHFLKFRRYFGDLPGHKVLLGGSVPGDPLRMLCDVRWLGVAFRRDRLPSSSGKVWSDSLITV